MPLGYLEFNGRPFGMAALASGHQEAILIKTQSVWEATFGPRQPPPIENLPLQCMALHILRCSVRVIWALLAYNGTRTHLPGVNFFRSQQSDLNLHT